MNLQVVTFNVNGLRSIKDYYAQSKLNNFPTFTDFLNSFEADIICFQEHKTNVPSKLSHDLSYPKGYAAFYAFPRIAKKIGYSGVVTFIKEQGPWTPIAFYDGFSGVNDKVKVPLHESPRLKTNFNEAELLELDSEGRCIITDHFHFLLLNIYFPNDSGPERAEFREKFYKAVQLRCLDLIKEHGKSLIILGDINIAYHPLDHCEYAPSFKTITTDDIKAFFLSSQSQESSSNALLNNFYSNPMRKWLAEWIFIDPEGWRDCFRSLNSFDTAREKYTCWNTQISARGSNYGTRIDTIFTAGPLFTNEQAQLTACNILPKVMGSDHCPVFAKFNFPEDFKEIQETVLKECKLTKGNIPRSFGKLDSFFKKRGEINQTEEIEKVTNKEGEIVSISTSNEIFTRKKCKISDYFQSTVIKSTFETVETTTTTTTTTTNVTTDCNNTKLKNLFNRPQNIPKCKHGEECKISKVKKSGLNQGRSFYCCARPGGASNDPEARCDYFEWVVRKR